MRPTRALVCFFLLGASVCHAASVCVNPGGTGGCLASIQQAVNTVAPRGRVDVAAGTYGESLSIPFGAQIQIYGAGAALTVIDGTAGAPVVLMGSTEDAGSSLAISDLTLTGGSDGVHAYNGWLKRVRTTISRCIISGNTGAGVATQGRLKMTDSSVRDNGGYGIGSSFGRAEIERSTISGNLGDGINCFASTCLILASTVSGNSGAGLASVPTRVLVRATTIAGNGVGLDIHDGYSALCSPPSSRTARQAPTSPQARRPFTTCLGATTSSRRSIPWRASITPLPT
jgi:hypothetical protein